jgi:Na+/melibiose symporter-like transporter
MTFVSSVIVQATSYFLPVYFQGVLGATPLRAGNYFLPYAIGTLVSAVIAGVLLSKTGTYRPLHGAAFILACIGFGLFTLLDSSTPKVAWVFYQLIASAGAGIVQSVLLPAIMSALPESDVASASAAYSFLRTFAYVWGVTLAAIIFNARFNTELHLISSPELRQTLADGAAYAYASNQFINGLGVKLKNEVVEVYVRSLDYVWWMGLAFSLLGLFGIACERGLELRKDLDTEYGLEGDSKESIKEKDQEGAPKV